MHQNDSEKKGLRQSFNSVNVVVPGQSAVATVQNNASKVFDYNSLVPGQTEKTTNRKNESIIQVAGGKKHNGEPQTKLLTLDGIPGTALNCNSRDPNDSFGEESAESNEIVDS